mmetsp:Transcript_20770/g.31954  ORF Transcript_20770/g.31954 Transcript_20770/m.31954 type:complete len:959 (+) Transcript_20770:55-2931(+)
MKADHGISLPELNPLLHSDAEVVEKGEAAGFRKHGGIKAKQQSVMAIEAAETMQTVDCLRHSSRGRSGRYGATMSMAQNRVDRLDSKRNFYSDQKSKKVPKLSTCTSDIWQPILGQIPAVLIVVVLNFMVGIPFGAAYFPVKWSSGPVDEGSDDDDLSGPFPLPGKEALGLRMLLFSTVVAQLVYTFESKFTNPIGLQMVENIPFCLELAHIVISEQGYGKEALSTLFFMYGLSSVLVGVFFYLLGKFKLGRVVYFFPSHVLVGCIGGIGAFIFLTAIEVTTDSPFSFSLEELQNLIDKSHQIGVVIVLEIILRLLIFLTSIDGKPRYPLLAPFYYCAITPLFYLALWVLRIDTATAQEAGYFFPSLDSCEDDCSSDSILDDHIFDIFKIIDFSTISWTAVSKSIPTLVSLACFSLIHVPINVPAFAISSNVEADMNAELVAHGYSNFISGMFGGLQNYMTYSNSVIYDRAHGNGKMSSLCIVFLTGVTFLVGPSIASYAPRCMAGTLLIHIGIDLCLEAVYDSFGNYDPLEYAGIWLITVVMITFGMSAALVAGVVAALSTFVLQSISYQKPIKASVSAARLRSSMRNRSSEVNAVLQDKKNGRNRIFVIQLQGEIFWGNSAILTDSIKELLESKRGNEDEPLIVILDFTLVTGMDSSAAQAIAKLKDAMHKKFNINVGIFVTGSTEGFPCEYNLSRSLSEHIVDKGVIESANVSNQELPSDTRSSLLQVPLSPGREGVRRSSIQRAVLSPEIPSSRVCESIDDALIFAENVLIALANPKLLGDDEDICSLSRNALTVGSVALTLEEEKCTALKLLSILCPGASDTDVKHLFSLLKREVYRQDDVIWAIGSESDCAKLLVVGNLLSLAGDTAGSTENIVPGAMIGELGLVNGTERLTTVEVSCGEAVLYSLSREKWVLLAIENPRLASYIHMIVIRYLAHRVQHVSNRIIECRSLPV